MAQMTCTKLWPHKEIPPTHSLSPHIFELIVYVHLPKKDRNKLQPRIVKFVFVGYETEAEQKGYCCFNPVNDKMYSSMDSDFFEISYYYNSLIFLIPGQILYMF